MISILNIDLDIVRLLPDAARGRGPGPGDRGLGQVQAQAALREGVQGGQPHRPVSTIQYSGGEIRNCDIGTMLLC